MRKTVSLLLCIFMLPMFMLTMPVKADFKDFPDVEGHWAYKSLKKAFFCCRKDSFCNRFFRTVV